MPTVPQNYAGRLFWLLRYNVGAEEGAFKKDIVERIDLSIHINIAAVGLVFIKNKGTEICAF